MPIRILDAATVGRIAAGEVVERPSSVVKELMENSIDAGSTAITVEIKGGGIDSLRVTDNGCGIEPEQVRIAFENHATSKLQRPEQLDDIRTLGFRGEALPSIAAVSHVEMTTRARNQDTGVRLNVDGGENIRVKEVGCPEGTTIVMKDLFYNIPVRRAFLKKAAYEGGLAADTVARILLGNPALSVRFINNGQTVYHSFGDGKLRHAVFAVYGKQAAEQMIETDASEGATRIQGLIGVGELARATRAHELFFINGRAVRCALLSKVLEEICRSRVTIGMYPMCVLNITLPPSCVDVNVHPNKLEVRFRDETAMRLTAEKLMASAFEGEKVLDFKKEAPAHVNAVTSMSTAAQVPAMSKPVPKQETVSAPKPVVKPEPVRPEKPKKEEKTLPDEDAYQKLIDEQMAKLGRGVSTSELREPAPAPYTYIRTSVPPLPLTPDPVPRKAPAPKPMEIETDVNYRVIGVFMKTYILVEADDSLILIDQHAAHERLQYEKLMARVGTASLAQPLLVPVILKLSAREMALIRDNLSLLSEAGYEVEPFGENDIQLRSVPFILGKAELKPAFMETINALVRVRSATVETRREEIMQMACKSAVKAGDTLSDGEIRSLIDQMLTTGAPSTCPHGRPVMKKMTSRDIEKMFRRIQ